MARFRVMGLEVDAMGTELEVRIRAWQRAGLVDAAMAERLLAFEAAEAAADGVQAQEQTSASPPPPPADIARIAARGPFLTAPELFAYLGAAFLLGAWYAFLASGNDPGESLRTGLGMLLGAGVLGLAAWWLVLRGESRARRGAGVALLVLYGDLGTGIHLVLTELLAPDTWQPFIPAIAAVVVVVVAFFARRRLPALLTQAGLALASIAAGITVLSWLESVLFPNREYGEGLTFDPRFEVIRAVAVIGWWIVVAAAMAWAMVIADRAPAAEGRHRVGRIMAGLTLVGGVSTGLFATYPWWAETMAGEPVLPRWLAAGLLVIAGCALVWIALRRQTVDYLWPGGVAIFSALTYLNAYYLADDQGLWVGLLVEAVVLFGTGLVVRRLAGRIATVARATG